MEQPRTRPPQPRPRRTAPLPPQAQGGRAERAEAGTVYRGARPGRPLPPVLLALRRFPNPRLTGLGSGLFCTAAMLVLGFLDALLLDGAAAVYGVLFVLVSGLTAGWVRKADLVTAPVALPIAFAVGALSIADGGGGLGARLMGVFTTLALNAGWLYAGTLLAGLIVAARRVRYMVRRAAQRRAGQSASKSTSTSTSTSASASKSTAASPSPAARRRTA